MSISSILDMVRGTRKAEKLSVQQRYHQLVRAVATDEDVDAQEAADILEQAGKSDEDFAADVANQAKRFSMAKLVAESERLERERPKLVRDYEAAKRALDEAVANLQPRVHELADLMLQNEREIQSRQHAYHALRTTAVDPAIVARESELRQLRVQLANEMQPMKDELRSLETRAQNLEARVQSCEHTMRSSTYRPERDEAAQMVRKLNAELSDLTPSIAQLRSELARLQSEMQPIDDEIQQLDARKLQP